MCPKGLGGIMPKGKSLHGHQTRRIMAIKIVEVIGISEVGMEDAVKNAVEEASKTVRNITGVDVIGFTTKVENGKIIS